MPKVLWSLSFGKKAYGDRPSTMVRVFERADAPGRIYAERCWVTGSGRVHALKHGTTRKGAQAWAKKLSAIREEGILKGRNELGDRKAPVALFELLTDYHDPKKNRQAKKWSERHKLEQERCKDFWKRALGDAPVEKLSQAKVEGKAGEAHDARGWSDRTEEKYLKYLMAATRWGKKKAKLYETDPLAGMDLPEVRYDTRARVYPVEDARKLMTLHPDVDWRVTLAFALAAVHGRRISAILHLWAGKEGADQEPDWAELEVTVRDGEGRQSKARRLFLHYRPEFDKGGVDEWVPAPEEICPLLEHALKQEEVQESGWFFPENRLGFEERREKPMRADSIIPALHEAEKTLGIPVIPRRGFHGAKRLAVTVGDEIAGGDLSIVGDVTGNRSKHVLANIYRQKDLGRMVRHTDGVAALLLTPEGHKADSNTDRR